MLVSSLVPLFALLLVFEAPEAPSRQTMTREIVRSCVAQVGTRLHDPTPSCACTAGWLSAQLDYRDFYVVGRMYRFATDPSGMETEVTRLVREGGYAPDDILRVARFMQDSEADMTAACGFLER